LSRAYRLGDTFVFFDFLWRKMAADSALPGKEPIHRVGLPTLTGAATPTEHSLEEESNMDMASIGVGDPVPSAVLHGCLDPSGAAPLAPSIRHFMEGRFRAGFGDVRIHTGPAAAALCGALRARALTWGRDIAFGAGQYDPVGEAGRRLLAHELAHVLQQRLAVRPGPSPAVPVGGPHDDCEGEADQLVEQALADGLRAPVTPDAAGAIRRVTFESDSLQLTIDRKGSGPAIFVQPQGNGVNQGSAVFHLNKNVFRNDGSFFDGMSDVENDSALRRISAINIKGSVIAKLDKGEDIGRMDFQFIQVARLLISQKIIAGCEPSGGSVSLDLADPNLFDGAGFFLVDSNSVSFPYLVDRNPKPQNLGNGRFLVTNDMDDHPFHFVELLGHNPLTNQANLLFFVHHCVAFMSAFVWVNDDSKEVRILAHVPWDVTWQAFFNWPAGPTGQPTGTFFQQNTQFTVRPWVKGPPADQRVADTIRKAHKSDKSKTIAQASEDADNRVSVKINALATGNNSQTVRTFGTVTDAIKLSKKWPGVPSPGQTFCGKK
jgi:hypothetical protein